jgi:glycosyltransferase involved in cell wall biosynthesis
MRRIFVLVPSLVPTGPIKGAVALCNSLVEDFDVSLVVLKPSPAFPWHIDSRVKVVDLGAIASWWTRLKAYRRMLEDAGGRARVASLSFCLSADVANFLVRRHAVTLSSIRGHLPKTYRVDYGPAGVLLAVLHYLLVRRLDCAIAMTDRMARQFAAITGKSPVVIGNFIDEAQMEPLRSPGVANTAGWRFVFLGRLDPLKSPDRVVEAVCLLAAQGIPCSLDVFGDGPMMAQLRSMVAEKARGDLVRFHGHVDNPWTLAADADCLVLPSLTEGVSRAALEALYLGIPCVMRDVDSNADLIRPAVNGELFIDDAALVTAMQNAARLGRRLSATRPVLLGESFRQAPCIGSYRRLLQES